MVMTCARVFRIALGVVAGVALMCAAVLAQEMERTGAPPATIPETLRQAVEVKGYRATADKDHAAEFWFARDLATSKKDVPGALYPELSNGEFVGIVQFAQAFRDFRGQTVPAGLYTLRYQLLPQDGNHLGVAPNPDFLLATPAAADAHPDEDYPYKKLVALSAKSTGGSHPAVFALDNASQPGTVTKTEAGTVLSVAVPSASGSEKIGICLSCAASQ